MDESIDSMVLINFPTPCLSIMFWTTWIFGSYACVWSINALATFCNSTCLAIFALMWKGAKGQSMIACPFSS